MKRQDAALEQALDALRSICLPAPIHRREGVSRRSTSIPGSDQVPAQDPAAWKDDFVSWKAEQCAHREDKDDSGAIGKLLVSFAEWCVARDAVPCWCRETFERLLQDAGFPCKAGWVMGLVLRRDLDAALCLSDHSRW
jgi:hypothetical protein